MTGAIEQDRLGRTRFDDRGAAEARARRWPTRGLGFFSIGLGLAEVAMPRRMARIIGLEDDDAHRNIVFACGVREIATGITILASDRPAGAVWARVGGDDLDLALLGRALGSEESERARVAAATAAALGVTALDVLTGRQLARGNGGRRPEVAHPRPAKGMSRSLGSTADSSTSSRWGR